MKKSSVIIVGGFHEIIELLENLDIEITGIIDNEKTESYFGYPVLCNDAEAIRFEANFKKIPLIITPDLPLVRNKLHNYYYKNGFSFYTLISKKANISRFAEIREGSIVQDGVNVSAEVNIGKFVKLNTNCNIMHNSIVGDYTTIAPNAVILGNVSIGKCSYIGANSTILPNISICNNVIVGAGAVVTKSIEIPGIYAGVPSKLLKN